MLRLLHQPPNYQGGREKHGEKDECVGDHRARRVVWTTTAPSMNFAVPSLFRKARDASRLMIASASTARSTINSMRSTSALRLSTSWARVGRACMSEPRFVYPA